MTTVEHAKRYMDLMAEGLAVVNAFSDMLSYLFALSDYQTIIQSVKEKMDQLWCEDDEDLLKYLETFLREIQAEADLQNKTIMALEFCRCMDLRITYLSDEYNKKGSRQFFSLFCLMPFSYNQCIEIGALNTNWKETRIWVNPKFQVASPYVTRDGEAVKKPISNRDIFEGMNGDLQNCSYVLWNEKTYVKNIIIGKDFLDGQGDKSFKIAFAPMSDRHDLIEVKDVEIVRGEAQMKGQSICPIKDSKILYERLQNDLIFAGDLGADVFFAPELLGTELSEQNDMIYNTWVSKVNIKRIGDQKDVPMLTILPSYWREQHNSVTILGQDGKILAYQEKNIPFVDKKGNKIEALAENKEWTTVLVHIPDVHRIAVVICAEFISDLTRMQKFICGSLGATLIIVPSYSRGEQDFINVLSHLKGYGTTVIWGDCCGAVSGEKRAIGGCGIAGTTNTITFGSVCRCGFRCGDASACVFTVEIPLDYEISKTEEFDRNEVVVHEMR